ncbi:hypothetical protein FFWV33_08310 [Flavobacterium faecale]|uniref:Uncharacterized protein n=1 Tax=Flavobacterium faecale TaxID=1355330 RepID=A0A2S1LCQ8_9FLAO|nr:DUF4173 domain-containing protein [Flavobacterium faecale]AWG21532.1 hypothetical protein FFWV33_08310 [Flavobacterium faecale]
MKKYHLIFGSTVVFSFLFYNESLGLNFALFALFLVTLIWLHFKNKGLAFKFFTVTTVMSALAFAWYGDGASFWALFFSLVFLQFQNQEVKLKLLQAIPIVIINGITSLGRPFIFRQWLPQLEIDNNSAKKLIAYLIIPILFVTVFFVAYSFGSDTFSGIFDYELDLDILDVILIASLGFYISFGFWNYFTPDYCYTFDKLLDNEFATSENEEIKPSFSFLDLEFERKSGEISLILLNVMLLVFIISYNYEQFFKVYPISNLSSATHDRVNAVIISIIMAVGVILFYFKKGFNFDSKAILLKLLAKIWIGLNGILIVSSAVKNSEYILHYGMTYKRLGVYAFLVITLIGLGITFYKIKNKKTNAFLFNQMILCLYGFLLLCSFVNWGNIITQYNVAVGKGNDKDFLEYIEYNDEVYFELFPEERTKERNKATKILDNQNDSFLSKSLYYENIDLK